MPDTKIKRFMQAEFDTLAIDMIAACHAITARREQAIRAVEVAMPLGEMRSEILAQVRLDATIAASCLYLIMHGIETGIFSHSAMLEKIRRDHGTFGAEAFEKKMEDFKRQWEEARPRVDFTYSPPKGEAGGPPNG